jgi:putative heme iron utilization protein
MTEPQSLDPEMFKLLTRGDAVLSTHSIDVEGFPFGSTTPYCLDANFVPNILVSSIAQHTKNIVANNKVSLFISEQSSQTNKQALGRLTYLGEALKVTEDAAIKQRYLNYFPEARDYFSTHNFSFYQIRPVRLRFIGGFGKIYWIEKESLNVTNIFSIEAETKIIEHMNQDHLHNLKDYARSFLKHEAQTDDTFRLCGLDQFGFDLCVNGSTHRIAFEEALSDPSEARSVFVKMAKISS